MLRPVDNDPEHSVYSYVAQVEVRAAQDKQGSNTCEVISDSDEQYIPRIRGGTGSSPHLLMKTWLIAKGNMKATR